MHVWTGPEWLARQSICFFSGLGTSSFSVCLSDLYAEHFLMGLGLLFETHSLARAPSGVDASR